MRDFRMVCCLGVSRIGRVRESGYGCAWWEGGRTMMAVFQSATWEWSYASAVPMACSQAYVLLSAQPRRSSIEHGARCWQFGQARMSGAVTRSACGE